MEYRLTHRGRTAEIRATPAGKVLEYLQNGHGVVNPHEVNYELQMENSQNILDSLVKAGYLGKEEESESAFGGEVDFG